MMSEPCWQIVLMTARVCAARASGGRWTPEAILHGNNRCEDASAAAYSGRTLRVGPRFGGGRGACCAAREARLGPDIGLHPQAILEAILRQVFHLRLATAI